MFSAASARLSVRTLILRRLANWAALGSPLRSTAASAARARSATAAERGARSSRSAAYRSSMAKSAASARAQDSSRRESI